MKNYVNKAHDKIKELGLEYSPELFSKILKEVKSCPKNIADEKQRIEGLRAFDMKNTKRKKEINKRIGGNSIEEITAGWRR